MSYLSDAIFGPGFAVIGLGTFAYGVYKKDSDVIMHGLLLGMIGRNRMHYNERISELEENNGKKNDKVSQLENKLDNQETDKRILPF